MKKFIKPLVVALSLALGFTAVAPTKGFAEEYVEPASIKDQQENLILDVDGEEIVAQPAIWPAIAVVAGFIARSGVKQAIKKWGPKIIKEMVKHNETIAKAVAKDLGYSATNYTSHGAKVYMAGKKVKGPKYITRDKDSHSGGSWKGAKTVKDLSKKETRSGTYDINLKRIGN